jgi:cellulose synthase (UDP-forming)
MRVLGSIALVVSAVVTSTLLVFMSDIASAPLRPPLVGFYEKNESSLEDDPLDLEVLFMDWHNPDAPRILEEFLRRSRQKRRIPLLTLEPHPDYRQGRKIEDLHEDTLRGRNDTAIASIASSLANHPGVVLLRFAHEMDIKEQYPWSFADPGYFVSFYRYVYRRFADHRLPHVRWVWSPAGKSSAKHFWPGSHYVDVVGLSAYATRAWSPDQSLESFSRIVKRSVHLARDHQLPLLIAEAGVSGSADEQRLWLKDAIATLSQSSDICGFVYFNAPQPYAMPLATGHEDWSLQHGSLRWLIQQLPLPARRRMSCVGS